MWQSAGSSPLGEPRHHSGSSSNGDSPVSSDVERRVAQQVQRERQPVPACVRRPRRAAATVPTWLARTASRPRVERAAERRRVTRASPYQLSSSTVALRRRAGRARAAARPRSRWCARPGRGRPARVAGRGEADARARPRRRPRAGRRRRASPRRPGIRASSRATQQPTMPAPTTATRSPTSGAASHSALTAVSTVPASTARAGGTSSGTTVTASAGTTYAVWCG